MEDARPLNQNPVTLNRVAKSLIAIFVNSQEHACSARNFEIFLVGTKDDHTGIPGPASTDDADVFESVSSTSIGGEYPKCLRSFIAVGRTSALRSFVGLDLAQDPTIDCFSHNVIWIIASRHGSTFAVNNITADLHCRQPAIYVALSWTNREVSALRLFP